MRSIASCKLAELQLYKLVSRPGLHACIAGAIALAMLAELVLLAVLQLQAVAQLVVLA